jgi:plastocyanin
MTSHWNRPLRPALGALLALGALATGTDPARAELREFYVVTVHYDGMTSVKGDANHRPEAFPATPFASTPGMSIKGPEANGDWSARTFVFSPAEMSVHQGDDVRLHFVGIQGGSHTIVVEGAANPVVVKRGTEQTVAFKAEKPGIVNFICTDHPPSMRGQVVVLPKN